MIPRLYVNEQLKDHGVVTLDRHQLHYVLNVLRLHGGDQVLLFNGLDGEWQAVIKDTTKKQAVLQCEKQTRLQEPFQEVTLLSALKRLLSWV
jgi:16S rRNA (uracil1498-N3)-methyltransferase